MHKTLSGNIKGSRRAAAFVSQANVLDSHISAILSLAS